MILIVVIYLSRLTEMLGAVEKNWKNFEKPLDKSKVMWYTLKVPQNVELLQIMERGILKIEQQTNLKKKNPENSEGKRRVKAKPKTGS